MGQGNTLCKNLQWEQGQRARVIPLDNIGYILLFSTSDLLNWKNSERTRVYPFRMDKGVNQTFESLKAHVASTPAWGLPNLLKPFSIIHS